MKRTLLLILLAGLNYTLATAQSEEYQSTMEDVVTNIQSSEFGEDLTPYANILERVAAVETKEWLPPYWAAFCYMMKSYTEPVSEKKDILLEKAEKLIVTAGELSPDNDEVEVLKANIASARLAVDPQNRWQKYGAISAAAITKAKAVNPGNPRITLHEAQGIFYTPEAFGGGKQKALPLIKAAIEQFEAFKPASSIMPDWGAIAARFMLDEAQK